jgi:hypothetical protein
VLSWAAILRLVRNESHIQTTGDRKSQRARTGNHDNARRWVGDGCSFIEAIGGSAIRYWRRMATGNILRLTRRNEVSTLRLILDKFGGFSDRERRSGAMN